MLEDSLNASKKHNSSLESEIESMRSLVLTYQQELANVQQKLQNTETKLSKLEDDMECIICNEQKATVLLQPCRHQVLCDNCISLLNPKLCPVCRTPFNAHIKAFFR